MIGRSRNLPPEREADGTFTAIYVNETKTITNSLVNVPPVLTLFSRSGWQGWFMFLPRGLVSMWCAERFQISA
jgi:hypothetical protein